MLKEFKEFVMRGNVVDLAVAVILAGAFGKIVTSFVNDILMPPVGMLLGGVTSPTSTSRLTGRPTPPWLLPRPRARQPSTTASS